MCHTTMLYATILTEKLTLRDENMSNEPWGATSLQLR